MPKIRSFLLILFFSCLISVSFPIKSNAVDWPQYQQNAQRTGRTTDFIDPPYRARWIWMGPNLTLRNKASNPAWPNNLTTGSSSNCPESKGNTTDCAYMDMPSNSDVTVAESVQPVIFNGILYVGTQEGGMFAINTDDGSTIWSKTNVVGGISTSAAVEGSTVVFTTMGGYVYAYNAANGSPLWSFETRNVITANPLIFNGVLYIGDHGGHVYALNLSNGSLVSNWSNNPIKINAPILGNLAVNNTNLFVGGEDMKISSINLSNGSVAATNKVKGQSFRSTHMVVFNNILWVTTATIPIIGSEYIADDLMQTATSLADEETKTREYLKGLGPFANASVDWQHVFALRTDNLQQATSDILTSLPFGGTGYPTESIAIDNQNRAIAWFKTRFPSLFGTQRPIFGSNYFADLASFNQTTGARTNIGSDSILFYPGETDNTFALSVAGNYVWYRQLFRGTKVIKISDPKSDRHVVAQFRHLDGGNNSADIMFGNVSRGTGFIWSKTKEQLLRQHSAPAISGNKVFVSEGFGIVAIERSN